MRFDDTLETVLAADLGSSQAAQSAWRQLVDLIGRRRAPAEARAMSTLRGIRGQVPESVRAASARALEFADPPAALVRLFAVDELSVALPVLRHARMTSAEWIQLLPDLRPEGRAVLRNRRDLGPVVKRALETFAPVDFVLPDHSVIEPERLPSPVSEAGEPAEAPVPVEEPAAALLEPESEALSTVTAEEAPVPIATVSDEDWTRPAGDPADMEVSSQLAPSLEEIEDFSFVALATTAAAFPGSEVGATIQSEVVAPQVQSGTVESLESAEAIAPIGEHGQGLAMDQIDLSLVEPTGDAAGALSGDSDVEGGPFEIAEVVARIDAFWRNREDSVPAPLPPAEHFRFETDATGVFRWVEGVSRAALVGLSLDVQSGAADVSRVDGVAAGAFRRRAGFSNARLSVEGESDAAGDWLISAIPVFDPANGRFTGYRGTGRRPRADERAEPARHTPPIPADSLRQLVHELRTPTNAIAGFAEMIESQILGPVSDPYRDRAATIRAQARELLGAIDDLDLAARIDSAALSLVPGRVALRPVLAGIADDLAPLTELRGSMLALPIDDLAVTGDRRAVERLLARLLATLVSASGPGERIGVNVVQANDAMVAITIDRPRALADYPGDSVLGIDDEREDATLLGTGFALRLARNLARELGGALVIEPDSLTLRLPASDNVDRGSGATELR